MRIRRRSFEFVHFWVNSVLQRHPWRDAHSWRMVGGSWVSVGSSWICFLGTGQFLQNFRTFTFKNNRMLPSFAVTLNAYFYMFSIEWRMDDISSPFPWSTEPAVKKTSGSFLDFFRCLDINGEVFSTRIIPTGFFSRFLPLRRGPQYHKEQTTISNDQVGIHRESFVSKISGVC